MYLQLKLLKLSILHKNKLIKPNNVFIKISDE